MKIAAIIQARMTSTRLFGKVLMDIQGKPMLWHIVDRLRHSKNLNDIILAFSDTKGNDPLEEFAKDNGIKYFRGSENDVLLRYLKTAQKFKIDVIIRITADCPLVDPEIVDLVVAEHIKSGADFTANLREVKNEKRTFPRGLDVEVFNLAALDNANSNAQNSFQREHVDPYFFENQDKFKIQTVHNKNDYSDMRWTVDEPADLDFIRQIYANLYRPGYIFLMEDVISLLREKPELVEINKKIKQKTI